MEAKVVTTFKDKEHQHVYRVGDSYPAEGFVADEKRIELLSKPHSRTKKVYLFVEKKEKVPEDTTEKQSTDTPPTNENTSATAEPKKKTPPRKKPTTEVGE
ncbi:hypothetical protein [Lysinibacillus sp. LZ02]|uniref:hypothetical protein n=1 Tax=Lysinibacillus sp. LZ02 TaxID=3420668 RepID=UPI003D366518